MKFYRIFCLILSITLISSLLSMPVAAVSPTDLGGEVVSSTDAQNTLIDIYQMRSVDAAAIAADMKIGINLGSSLDSWSLDNGYDDYHNASAYQMMVIYYNEDNEFDSCIPYTFEADNTCTINWDTDFIMSCKPQTKLGKIGFIITNYTVDKPTPIKINVKTAYLAKDTTKIAHNLDELLGEHELVISRYGTTALYTEKFPSHLTKTLGVQGSHYKVEVELVEYPEHDYTKEQYYETLDQNPLISAELIGMLKQSGFNAVRLPVTYFNHTNSENTVDKAWLDRISQVVEYILSQGMYCIVDMHNDGDVNGWLHSPTFIYDDEGVLEERDEESLEAEQKMLTKYESIWRQIAERLKAYGDHLLFEGFDELTNDTSEWSHPGKDSIDWTNELNQLFVDTVRSTGGNNSQRCLLVAPYAGSNENDILADFKLPDDSAEDRLIVSVHAYTPATLSWHYEDENEVTAWGTQDDKTAIDELFSRFDKHFLQNGIPVIVSEFGTVEKAETGVYEDYSAPIATEEDEDGASEDEEEDFSGNSEADDDSQIDLDENDVSNLEIQTETPAETSNVADRTAHAVYYTGVAKQYGIPCFWYDDGTFIDRDNNLFFFEQIVTEMINTASTHVNTLYIDPVSPQYYNGSKLKPTLAVYNTAGQDVTVDESAVSSSDVPGVKLTYGIDYNVIYSDNVELGTATITIYGLGDYTGVTSTTFEIVSRPELVEILTSGFMTGSPLGDLLTLAFSIPIIATLCIAAVVTHRRKKQYDERRQTVTAATEQARQEIYVNYSYDDDFDDLNIEEEPQNQPAARVPGGFFNFALPANDPDEFDDDL